MNENHMQFIWVFFYKQQSIVTGFYLISDSVFGILMILFAGGWSDKRGKRKPCMLIPMIGELAALIGR